MDFFCGIGDVTWWIKSELDKLTEEETTELLWICKYKTYIKNLITAEKIKKLAEFFGCEMFNIFRTGNKNIVELFLVLSKYRSEIKKGSLNCIAKETIAFKEQKDIFEVLSFEEFKIKT